LTFTIADVTATTPAISFLRAETGSTGAAIIASATGSGATPYFYVTDQLGSVRAVVDGQGSVVERNDYYTYGKRHTTGRTYADLKNSPLLFSGKEDQGQALDIASGATTLSDLRILDFGARHYDPIVPRWTTPDPLAEKYFPITPYAYCAGDPVRCYDPDGMEWEDNGSVITVTVNVSNSDNIDNKVLESYKKAIAFEFNRIITIASLGKYSGSIIFRANDNSIIQTLSFERFGDSDLGGSTHYMFSSINVNDKDGQLASPEIVAQSTLHELFHTIGLTHPFDLTQTADTELLKIGPNQYISTKNTDDHILNNVMNYPIIQINGQYCNDMRYLTPGQFEIVRKEIVLQKAGFGYPQLTATGSSLINRFLHKVMYSNYWYNYKGNPVKNATF
nr:hypothetical protein [Bacteroidales bacterium]